MLSSWFCRPKLPATSTTIWRQVQGIVGRKSVTTNCRHWKAVRINVSLKKRSRILGVLRHLQTVPVKLKLVMVVVSVCRAKTPPFPPTKASPLVVADGSYDAKHEGPAGPQAVPLALEDLQDALQLFLPNVCVEDIGQLLQGVEQQKLQPLRSKEGGESLTSSAK